jgi:hypothetical protein
VLWPTTATFRSSEAEKIFMARIILKRPTPTPRSGRGRGSISWSPGSRLTAYDAFVTVVSCLAIGLAFGIAVGLLVFAGTLLGWFFSRALDRRAARQSAARRRSSHIDPPSPGG